MVGFLQKGKKRALLKNSSFCFLNKIGFLAHCAPRDYIVVVMMMIPPPNSSSACTIVLKPKASNSCLLGGTPLALVSLRTMI